MAGTLSRGLQLLRYLAVLPHGANLTKIAEDLDLPKSTAHRVLSELTSHGFTQQSETTGDYAVSLAFTAMSLTRLGQIPLVDFARPSLQRLATTSGDLVRLCLVEGDDLYWVDKRQAPRTGLVYADPESGARVQVTASATGIAWLAAHTNVDIERLVERNGFGEPNAGGKPPRDMAELMTYVRRARRDGFAYVDSTWGEGLSAMARVIAPNAGSAPVGVISIAGPSIRLTKARAAELSPALHDEVKLIESFLAGQAPDQPTTRAGSV